MSHRLPVLLLVAVLMVPTSMPTASAIGFDCVPFFFNPWCPGGWALAWLAFLKQTLNEALDTVEETCAILPQCPL